MPAHHPIFDTFHGYVGPLEEGVLCTWIGDMYRPVWVNAPSYPAIERHEAPLPSFDEEYFEWLSLLEATLAARDRFVMIELGAGYGRWGVRGALAAKQRGIRDIDIRFVEAEPQHVAWIREAIDLNRLHDISTTILEAAVSYAGQPVPFAIEYPEKDLNAHSWYGQAVWIAADEETDRTYFDRKIYRTSEGVDRIMVDVVTFEAVTADLDRIDLVDIDLQGAEQELVTRAIETFSAKVVHVHIGTHGIEIENAVRRTFTEAGWTPGWDFSVWKVHDTPYGPISFDDGVQTWTNPKFSG